MPERRAEDAAEVRGFGLGEEAVEELCIGVCQRAEDIVGCQSRRGERETQPGDARQDRLLKRVEIVAARDLDQGKAVQPAFAGRGAQIIGLGPSAASHRRQRSTAGEKSPTMPRGITRMTKIRIAP